ncbi:MAG TPA: MIP/aquaporin family protein, partial [Desulfuromonadaceae bacterium]|nr:MIP/aquaporin family protein [Desulfuromonadaceae bacterium]
MSKFSAELIGTMILIILGDGVVANVLLNRSKGQNSGWIVIAIGWGLAVTVGVYTVGTISGGHLNPAVTIALAAIGKFAWSEVPRYVVAQMIGAFLGAVIVWLAYLPHWKETPDPGAKLGVFCTAPAIRHPPSNLLTEIIGTFILVL